MGRKFEQEDQLDTELGCLNFKRLEPFAARPPTQRTELGACSPRRLAELDGTDYCKDTKTPIIQETRSKLDDVALDAGNGDADVALEDRAEAGEGGNRRDDGTEGRNTWDERSEAGKGRDDRVERRKSGERGERADGRQIGRAHV